MAVPRKVLVTGATGRLGILACKELSSRGWIVRALVRNLAKAKKSFAPLAKEGGEFEFFKADVLTASAGELKEACAGVQCVVHAAALIREDADEKAVFRVNTEGTRLLVSAAKKARVKRFVLVSSTNVYGTNLNGEISEERGSMGASVYGKSKELAERAVVESGLEFVILRPCQIYGKSFAGDFERIANALKRGKKFVVAPFGHMHLVHSNDVVRAIAIAAEKKAAANQAFNIASGETISHKRFAEELARTLGAKPPVFGIPPAVAYSAAFALSKALSLVGKKSGFRPENVLDSASKHSFSIENAKLVLGWEPVIMLPRGLREMYS